MPEPIGGNPGTGDTRFDERQSARQSSVPETLLRVPRSRSSHRIARRLPRRRSCCAGSTARSDGTPKGAVTRRRRSETQLPSADGWRARHGSAVTELVSVHDATWTTDRSGGALHRAAIDPFRNGLDRLVRWGENPRHARQVGRTCLWRSSASWRTLLRHIRRQDRAVEVPR